MFETQTFNNLAILFILGTCMLGVFWWFIRLINWSQGFNLKKVVGNIYENPLAAAIYRGALIYTVGQLVIAAFSRWV